MRTRACHERQDGKKCCLAWAHMRHGCVQLQGAARRRDGENRAGGQRNMEMRRAGRGHLVQPLGCERAPRPGAIGIGS